MKKISNIKLIVFITFVSVTGIYSCKKLDENPNSVIVSSQFYKTASDANSAVNAVYSALNSDPAATSLYMAVS